MENLIKTAKELNDELGLDPEIATENVDEKKLKKDVKKAAELIDWEADEISPEAVQELVELGVEVPAENLPNQNKPEPEEKPGVDLVALLDKTTKLKDLKALVEKHDEFKPLRKTLIAAFSPSELKEDMMGFLGIEFTPAEEPTEEPAAKPKAEKPKKEKPAAKPKAEKPKKEKPATKSRWDMALEAIEAHKPNSDFETLVEASDALGQEHGKPSNKSESKFIMRITLKILEFAGMAEIKDGNVTLNG